MKDSNYLEDICLQEESICVKTQDVLTHINKPRAKRPLEDLNLIDSYLFNASTERIQDAEVIARIIVERATGQKLSRVIIETEKQLKGIETDHRGIRMDLFISEFDSEKIARVYDIEPNNYDLNDIPRRDRYNQAMSDVKLLETKADFRQLPEYISIWILPRDPFGYDRMIYTVKNVVVENDQIVYNDGVLRLFLNAKGHIGGNDSLRALLSYFCESSQDNATDPELEKVHNIVTGVKQSKEVGERYMTWQEVINYEVELAKQELREEMREEVVAEVREEVAAEVREEVAAEVREEVAAEVREEVAAEVREEVVAEVRKEGMRTFAKSCLGVGVSGDKVIDMLVKEFSITKEEAVRYVDEVRC